MFGPIRGFEGPHHGSEDAMDWDPSETYAPDGEVVDPEDPLEDLSPGLEPMEPDPVPELEEDDEVIDPESPLGYCEEE